jgi:hypothetical protein
VSQFEHLIIIIRAEYGAEGLVPPQLQDMHSGQSAGDNPGLPGGSLPD